MEVANFNSLLSDKVLANAIAKLNITEPTEVQARAIPAALSGKDLIVQAQTGSGKTLAFTLPIVSKIRLAARGSGTLALVVAPTRELALQVKAVVSSISPHLTPACLIGGASSRAQENDLENDGRMVIGTPGRLLDFIRQGLLDLRKCETFVLDEADEMLSMGFLEDVNDILRKLPKVRQGMFFSATISNRVLSLAAGFLKNPETITVEINKSIEPKIEHIFYRVEGGLTGKVDALCKIFTASPSESAIVFCNTKSETELVEVMLKRRGFDANKINSDLSQKERDKVLTSLRNGNLSYLIATDIAARGIDIKGLEMVINYTLPKEPEIYTHRAGRTGRAEASGKAISLIAPQDTATLHILGRTHEVAKSPLRNLE